MRVNRMQNVTKYYMAPDPTFGVTRGPCIPDFHCGLFLGPDLDTGFDSGCFFPLLHDYTHRF
jgi:hypothetical protein